MEVLENLLAQGPALPSPVRELRMFMAIGQELGVPLHLVQSEGVKMLRETTGKAAVVPVQPVPVAPDIQTAAFFDRSWIRPNSSREK